MYRRIVYINAQPLDLDILATNKHAMIGLGWLAQGILGVNTVVDGLQCIPTTPGSLSVQILPGAIYSLNPIDQNAYGSLPADTAHQIIKQGIVQDTTTLTLVPPLTSGQALNYLIQVEFTEVDTDTTVLPYYDAANPDVPFSGPNNSGTSQPLTRKATVTISAKAGVAATAGSQTTPAPDAGYTGLYSITVAQGATVIGTGNIAQLATAPFINPKLPGVPAWVQNQNWCYGVDTGAANAITAVISPIPPSYAAGFSVRIKVAATNTGATTLNVNNLGAKSVKRSDGTDTPAGSVVANGVFEFVYDGTQFYLQTAQAQATSTSTGGLTAVATTSPIIGDGTSGNPVRVLDTTHTQKGAVKFSTSTEFDAGSDTTAVTPAQLAGLTSSSPIATALAAAVGGLWEVKSTKLSATASIISYDISGYEIVFARLRNAYPTSPSSAYVHMALGNGSFGSYNNSNNVNNNTPVANLGIFFFNAGLNIWAVTSPQVDGNGMLKFLNGGGPPSGDGGTILTAGGASSGYPRLYGDLMPGNILSLIPDSGQIAINSQFLIYGLKKAP